MIQRSLRIRIRRYEGLGRLSALVFWVISLVFTSRWIFYLDFTCSRREFGPGPAVTEHLSCLALRLPLVDLPRLAFTEHLACLACACRWWIYHGWPSRNISHARMNSREKLYTSPGQRADT